MISIEEIKHRISTRKRKWSSSLIAFIQPKINEGYTYEYISNWLKTEHDIEISAAKLIYYKFHNKNVIVDFERKRDSTTIPSTSNLSPKNEHEKIEQNVDYVEKVFGTSDILSVINEKAQENKKDVNKDFKNKFKKKTTP
jgi:IS30 family transposase